MTIPVRISAAAEAELVEAARWYQNQRGGLGIEFLDAVDDAVSRVADTPDMGSAVPGVSDQSIRRRAVLRFPYHVVYIVLSDRIQILAVAHDRRRPGYWVGRLPA